jgi:FkbM family methyltransferase
MTIAKIVELKCKAISLLGLMAERPAQAFHILRLALFNRPYIRELAGLRPHKLWLEKAGIQTVIDVGAHTGSFAYAVRAFLPEAQIYSFEPLADGYQSLTRNLARSGRFQAFNVALGDAQGEIAMQRSEFSPSSSILPMAEAHKQAFPWTVRTEAVPVRIQRLDDFQTQLQLKRKVLLKIDVQGYEMEVLRGGANLLAEVDYLNVECSFRLLYEGQASFEQVYQFLAAQGFAYAGDWGQMFSPLDGSILQTNALFARPAGGQE